jgi:hypothetical protein
MNCGSMGPLRCDGSVDVQYSNFYMHIKVRMRLQSIEVGKDGVMP